jgi:transposase
MQSNRFKRDGERERIYEEVIHDLAAGVRSAASIAKEFGLSASTVRQWKADYKKKHPRLAQTLVSSKTDAVPSVLANDEQTPVVHEDSPPRPQTERPATPSSFQQDVLQMASRLRESSAEELERTLTDQKNLLETLLDDLRDYMTKGGYSKTTSNGQVVFVDFTAKDFLIMSQAFSLLIETGRKMGCLPYGAVSPEKILKSTEGKAPALHLHNYGISGFVPT